MFEEIKKRPRCGKGYSSLKREDLEKIMLVNLTQFAMVPGQGTLRIR